MGCSKLLAWSNYTVYHIFRCLLLNVNHKSTYIVAKIMIILLFLVIWVIKPVINMLLLFRIMFFLMEKDKSGKGGQEVQNLSGVIP